jgi:hypothetical protein
MGDSSLLLVAQHPLMTIEAAIATGKTPALVGTCRKDAQRMHLLKIALLSFSIYNAFCAAPRAIARASAAGGQCSTLWLLQNLNILALSLGACISMVRSTWFVLQGTLRVSACNSQVPCSRVIMLFVALA